MALARPYEPKMVQKTKTLGILLYLFVIPPFLALIFSVVTLQVRAFVFDLVSFTLFLLALYLSKKGFEQEFAYHQSPFALAPKVPYKLLGALSLSFAVLYTSAIVCGRSWLESIFLAIVSFAGYYLWYGFDPKEDKVPQTGDVGVDVAYRTIQEAKEHLDKIETLLPKISHPRLREQMQETLQTAKEVIAQLEQKPLFVREARRFLVVYTESLLDLANSYIAVQEGLEPQRVEELLFLLEQTQERFEKELRKVQEQGKFDLDVKMRTLNHQIKS